MYVSRYFSGGKLAVVFALCLWNATCGGTLYMFAGLETDLMQLCNWTAADVDALYSAGQIGVGLGFVSGAVFHYCGVFYSCIYSFVLVATGSTLFYLGLPPVGPNVNPTSRTTSASAGAPGSSAKVELSDPTRMAFYYFMIQHGSVTLYQNGLYTGLLLTRKTGLATGILASGFGLSAAIYNFFYVGAFGRSVHSFVYYSGILWAVTGIVGSLVLQVVEVLAAPSAASAEPYREMKETDHDLTPDSDSNSLLEHKATWRDVLQRVSFWTVFVQFCLTQSIGSGLFMGNLKLLTGSLGYSPQARDSVLVAPYVVTTVSFCNAGGRLATGLALDAINAKVSPSFSPDRMMLFAAASMLLSNVMLFYVEDSSSEVFLLLVGFAYGSNWATLPTFAVRKFGVKNMVFVFSMPVLFMSVMVKLVAHVTGSSYDAAFDHDSGAGDESFCTPASRCFAQPAKLAVGFCSVSLLCGLWQLRASWVAGSAGSPRIRMGAAERGRGSVPRPGERGSGSIEVTSRI
eukprot:g13205.t1